MVGMLFADIRGSTTLAAGMSLSDFSRLINRFYSEAAYAAAGLQIQNLEKRILELKGKSEPVSVYVVTDYSQFGWRSTFSFFR